MNSIEIHTPKQLVLNHLPEFARYVLRNYHEELTSELLENAREARLPILNYFSHLNEIEFREHLGQMVRDMLQHLSDNEPDKYISRSLAHTFAREKSDSGLEKIYAENISLLNYVRKKSLLTFIPKFTDDVTHILELVSEIDALLLQTEALATSRYVTTLREKIEEQVHFSLQISKATPGVIFIFDLLELREIYSSAQVQSLFAYSSSGGRSVLHQLVHADDVGNLIQVLDEFRHSKENITRVVEYRIRYRTGRYHWVRNYGSVFRRDDAGFPNQIIVIGFDIDKEKLVDEQLRVREEQYEEAQRMAGLGSFEWDLITRRLKLSRQVKEILEIDDNFSTELLVERVHPADMQKVRETLRKAIQSDEFFDCEYRYVVNGGEKVLWSRARLQKRNDYPVLRGTVMDVTERHRLTRQLQKSDELYKQAQALAHIGNWTYDIGDNEVSWSEELYRIYGLDPAGPPITYDRYMLLIHPEDRERVQKTIGDCLVNKQPYEMYHRLITPAGQVKQVLGIGDILLNENGEPKFLFGTAQDVTERQRLVQQLEESDRLYKQAQALTHIGNYVLHLKTNTFEWSDELFRIYEIEPRKKLSVEEVSAFIKPADLELGNRLLRAAIENRKPFDLYYHIITANNNRKIVHSRGEIVTDSNGEPVKVTGTVQDVTERQELLEQLQRRDELYKQAQALSHIGNWTWNRDDNSITCSDEIFRIYGLTDLPEQLKLDEFIEWVHPKERSHVRDVIHNAIDEGNSFDMYHRTTEVGGMIKTLRIIGEVQVSDSGDTLRIFGTTQDVTEQKKIEEELLQNQMFIRKIADATPSIITTYNINSGRYHYISGGLKRLLGFEPDQAMKEGVAFFMKLIHPEDLQPLLDKNVEALRESNKLGLTAPSELISEFRYRSQNSHGEYRWLQTYGTVFDRNEDGMVENVLNISIDITERIRAEDKIRDQDYFIQHIAEASPNVLYLFDARKGSVIYINREIAQVLDYSPEEIVGMGSNIIPTLYHPSDAVKIPERLMQYNDPTTKTSLFQFECRMKHRSGEWRWLLMREIVFRRDGEGNISEVLGAALDITGRKKTEDSLFRKTLELQQSNTSLEEFAYVASHDLQEPLRKISTFGDRLMHAERKNLSPEGADFLKKIVSSSVRMQQMINDVLSISTIAGDRNFEACNLNNIFKEVIQALEHKIEEKHAQIEYSELPVANVIPSQFRQLFQNLLSNALKFSSRSEQPKVTVKHSYVSVAPENAKDPSGTRWLQIEIADNGIGFDNRFADKIFAIFQRLHSKSEYEGTGIGLAICKRIIENHGGAIRAEGHVNQGSTFIVTIPA